MSDGDDSASPRRRYLRRVGALAGALGLAGCSGLGDGGDDATRTVNPSLEDTPTRTATPTPAPPPVQLSPDDFPTGIDGFPMFGRDPGHTGYAPDDTGPEEGAFGWRVLTDGAVHASPAIADGAVFVSSLDGFVYAVDLPTGKERWRVETGGGYSSPAVVDGTVYVGGLDGAIRAIDAATGEVAWQHITGGKVHSGATVADGTVYVGSFDSDVYALDAATGEPDWRFDTGSIITTSPTVDDERVYVVGHGGRLYALDRADGTEVWRRSTGEDEFSTVATAGGTVFFASLNDRIYAIDAETGEDHWWKIMRAGMPASPAVTPETVYIPVFDKYLYALDAGTGERRWRTKVGLAYSSPAVAGGRVHFGTASGTVYALDTASGEVAWTFDAGADVRSSPAVVDGTLVVGAANGALHAVGADVGRPILTSAAVVLTGAPNGLEKFTITLDTGEAVIAELTPELLTGTSFWVETGGIGTSTVTASGVALEGQASLGADGEATLFTVGLGRELDREAFTMTVETLTDSDGTAMDADRVALRLAYPDRN